MDLSGHTAAAQMRRYYKANTAVTFSTAISNNQITLNLTAFQTANVDAGVYFYDVEIDDGSNTVTRVLQGSVSVTPEVTKI